MTWYVTYLLILTDTTKETVESFKFNPTDADMNDVGEQLAAEYNALSFVPMRGMRNWKGEWIDYE